MLFSQPTDSHQMPWSFSSVKVLYGNFNYFLAQFIVDHGKLEAIELIAGLVSPVRFLF